MHENVEAARCQSIGGRQGPRFVQGLNVGVT